MSLKNEFNKQVFRKPKINEITLIDSFIDAINSTPGNYATKYHGRKGFVKFDINVNVPLISYTNVVCEIADVLCIFIGDREVRYTFIQNKFSKPAGSDVFIQHVNTRQYYLLSERPIINPLFTGLFPTILKDALCPGVGSYGDFYKDHDVYDMRYFVAKTLLYIKNKKSDFYNKKRAFKFHNTYVDKDWLNSYNNVLECSHTCGLDEFEIMSKNMLIGTPVDFRNKKLCMLLYKAVEYVLLKSDVVDNNIIVYLREVFGINDDIADDTNVNFGVSGIALFDYRQHGN